MSSLNSEQLQIDRTFSMTDSVINKYCCCLSVSQPNKPMAVLLYFKQVERKRLLYTHTRTHCSMLLSDWVKVTVHPKTTAIHKMAPDVIQDFGSCKDHKLIWKDPLQTQCMHSWFQLLKKVTNNVFKSIWALGASGVIDYTRKAVRSHFMWRFFFLVFKTSPHLS